MLFKDKKATFVKLDRALIDTFEKTDNEGRECVDGIYVNTGIEYTINIRRWDMIGGFTLIYDDAETRDADYKRLIKLSS